MKKYNYFKIKPEKLNILIIEESSSLIKIINDILLDYGYNTFISKNIKEARKKLNENRIDYIILDINLSDKSEYKLIKELSSSKVKIIILTSEEVDIQLKEISYQDGIIDYINKDKNFIYQASEIPDLIYQIEKNKLKTILIVDDSYSVRRELKDIFINRNYNVLVASTIKEATSLIKVNKIDLMLLDFELKESNSYDFLIKNKKLILDELRIKVLILTKNVSSTLLRDAIRIGVNEVIKKPYLLEELILKTDIFINDKDQDDETTYNAQLLNQYKDTVDRSSIVSKANSKGSIIYVNDAFCEISGYKREELLGKNHNIVKHPDMDSLIFKEIWKTIKDLKSPWRGVLKNRKKDGSSYWVQTIINPIIDDKGKIIEYIGIRTDITDTEETKEYLKKQYDISQNNFKEILNLSKLYENAIEQGNIIVRIDKNKIITYADKQFYNISGFSKNEIIGKEYSFLDSKNINIKENLMWKELQKGKIWKGQISNKFKDNKVHHFLATVVPIKNLKGEILEYMSIRKNITEVVQLHQEIEETQREIIYKVGEIGESRSNETGNHVKRVAHYSKLLASLYGLDKAECDILFTASPMHDIGKVGIPDSILNKPDKLTSDEWIIMKNHTTIGHNILHNSKRDILKAAAIVSMEHHEKWDGSGYPRKLKGEEIHIYGRITAVADVFDALGSDRCYKKAWKEEDIITFLENEKGKQFDPKLIDLFFNNINKFKEIRDRYKDQLNEKNINN